MTETILILGGTKEAAALAASLVAEKPNARIVTSLAGRTREPKPVAGETRTGGFGGADGLATWLQTEGVSQVIDATHPFAEQISKNALAACERTGTPLEVRKREPWQKQPGDTWREATNIHQAVAMIPAGARVLLALGRQHIAPFAEREDVWFLVRMVDAPSEQLDLPAHELLLQRPSAEADDEQQVLLEHQITHIVCRNSGGPGAYAKIEAARELSLPVIMIARPQG
ncbi:MAG: cobalt-precorrin-6A reductase [Pseudomonadota bacterium]